MKYKIRILGILIVVVSVLFGHFVWAQSERGTDKTLSPYFFVKSDDPDIDQLPLKATSVKINISGVIADVTVTQLYKNEGKRPLEAIYIFPASTRAAVYSMKMTVGERTIIATIRERKEAQRVYEEAKQAGKSASLLEQQRPNVFQMNVANILPADVITVELKYTELLIPTDAVYEFIYPTVVGPRYSDRQVTDADPRHSWIENPYLHQGESPTSSFDIEVGLVAGLPIHDLTCTSHQIDVNFEGPTIASIKLNPAEKYGGNRDFLLKYRLAGGKIETGLLLFEEKEENFFLLMLQPPKRVSEIQIPPREYIFIVDVSGSMHGFPLHISKKLLKDLIENLRPTDRFNVLLFAGGSSVMSKESLPATPTNIANAIHIIERQRGGGGTRLLPALKRALSLPKARGVSRSVIIATDGYVNIEEEAFDLVRHNLGHANMFTFGIGSSVNRHLIEGMARVGMGEPFVITKPEEAPEKARTFRKLIQSPVLSGIKIDFGHFKVYDVEPTSIPDVFADRPVVVFGKWRGKCEGSIHLKGTTGEQSYTNQLDIADIKPLGTNSALRYLWARHKIGLLSDYNRLNPQDERVKEITNLGLTYNLLTAYTSFVAIDTRLRLGDGQVITVKQPLPLPQGVSDYAIGKRRIAGKGMSFALPSSTTMTLKTRVSEERLEYKNEGHPASDPLMGEPDHEIRHIQLSGIAVNGGLSKDSIQRIIEKNIRSINRCYTQRSGKAVTGMEEIVFSLLVDPEGNIIEVNANKGKCKISEIHQCIIQQIRKLHFPAPEAGKNVRIILTFILR